MSAQVDALAIRGITIAYGRDDVDYETWYSEWMKNLALLHTLPQLEQMLFGGRETARKTAQSHLRAVDATTSMHSQSQRRAQTRNSMAAASDLVLAIRGAIEIHVLFPEHARQER